MKVGKEGEPMRTLYKEVMRRLETIDFSILWEGFKPYPFALYTSTEVYLEDKVIPWDTRFMGCTAISYEGSYLAIWNIEMDGVEENVANRDQLVMGIVHEMFHAFQQENKEKRFPMDLVGLNYPDDERNYGLKYVENQILARACREESKQVKQELLSQFYSIRKERERILGDIITYEYRLETVEGIAEYVGLLALKQLDKDQYEERLEDYCKKLETYNALQQDIRCISYFCGPVILTIAKACNLSFWHVLKDEGRPVFQIIGDKVQSEERVSVGYDEILIQEAVKENRLAKSHQIEAFFKEKAREAIEGRYAISGYDPMNMFKLGNQVYCKNFICVTPLGKEESMMLIGPIVLEMDQDEVRKIYK